jgi:RNA polymerase sigma-70 factor (ECF subfamily)
VAEPDDLRLVEKLRAGDRAAGAELVRACYPLVYRFLVHLARDVHLAEDLTQETFGAAWQRIGTFQGRATLKTWLHRIAYSKFIDNRRAGERAKGIRQRLARPTTTPPCPLDRLQSDDEARRLYLALDELDESPRTMLVLHYLQDLSYQEMATILNEPTGTVKWRTMEALKKLRELLSDEVSNHAARKTTEPRPIA